MRGDGLDEEKDATSLSLHTSPSLPAASKVVIEVKKRGRGRPSKPKGGAREGEPATAAAAAAASMGVTKRSKTTMAAVAEAIAADAVTAAAAVDTAVVVTRKGRKVSKFAAAAAAAAAVVEESPSSSSSASLATKGKKGGYKKEAAAAAAALFSCSPPTPGLGTTSSGDDEAASSTSRILPPSLPPTWEIRLEETYNIKFVIGVDEAGRGPLAGPVVAAACYIPSDVFIPGLQDSKKMDEAAREEAFEALMEGGKEGGLGVRWAVEVVGEGRIDEVNILQATLQAMGAALRKVVEGESEGGGEAGRGEGGGERGMGENCYALIDGNQVPKGLPMALEGERGGGGSRVECVVKGDSKVRCIAAASILAKVTRDRIMVRRREGGREGGREGEKKWEGSWNFCR